MYYLPRKIFFLQFTIREEFFPKMVREYEKPFAEEWSKKERKEVLYIQIVDHS